MEMWPLCGFVLLWQGERPFLDAAIFPDVVIRVFPGDVERVGQGEADYSASAVVVPETVVERFDQVTGRL